MTHPAVLRALKRVIESSAARQVPLKLLRGDGVVGGRDHDFGRARAQAFVAAAARPR